MSNFLPFEGGRTILKEYKCGFTLAETLITLVIIGVVAALTVPTLMNRTNNQEYVSKLQKTYSTLSQATNKIISEEGTPRADKGGWATSAENVYNLYKKYLINAKECGQGNDCIKQVGGNGFQKLNGGDDGYTWNIYSGLRRLVLQDGVQIAFWKRADNCQENFWGSSNICTSIYVDINGEKNQTNGAEMYFSLH